MTTTVLTSASPGALSLPLSLPPSLPFPFPSHSSFLLSLFPPLKERLDSLRADVGVVGWGLWRSVKPEEQPLFASF
jgi:hypothetical protein